MIKRSMYLPNFSWHTETLIFSLCFHVETVPFTMAEHLMPPLHPFASSIHLILAIVLFLASFGTSFGFPSLQSSSHQHASISPKSRNLLTPPISANEPSLNVTDNCFENFNNVAASYAKTDRKSGSYGHNWIYLKKLKFSFSSSALFHDLPDDQFIFHLPPVLTSHTLLVSCWPSIIVFRACLLLSRPASGL